MSDFNLSSHNVPLPLILSFAFSSQLIKTENPEQIYFTPAPPHPPKRTWGKSLKFKRNTDIE
jgi:hypothetical protein